MRLITFSDKNGMNERLGAYTSSGQLVDLALAAQVRNFPSNTFRSMLDFIRAGDAARIQATEMLEDPPHESLISEVSIRWRAPLPIPESIRDLANYELHVSQAIRSSMTLRARATPDPTHALAEFRKAGLLDIPPVWYELPLYYKGNRFSCIGHDEPVYWPTFAEKMDYELELAVIIGKTVRDIPEESAMEAVFGYTIFNDFSARDQQSRETSFRMGPAKGKDFDTGNAFGPCIVTRDEIPNPESLRMAVRINGKLVTETVSGGMQHGIAKCISYISQSETLHPGEIIGLGTLGNGCGYESLSFLQDGDEVELEVENIGTLRNRLMRPQ